jgi:hypothetical protein
MSNAVPAHSYYGKPQGDYRLAHIDGAKIASASAPYVGRGNKCSGNEDTCEGMRAKGTEFCMGHLRKVAKEVVADGASTNDAE